MSMTWKMGFCCSLLALALMAGDSEVQAAGHGHGGGGSHGLAHGGFHGASHSSFHGGSFNSFHGGFHNGFHGGFNDGFGHHHSFFPFFGFGFGYPFYGSYYGGFWPYGGYGYYNYPYYRYPSYYDYVYPSVYNAAPTVIYLSSAYAPSSLPVGNVMPYSDEFGGGANLQAQPNGIESAPPPRPWQEDRSTYPYDGGPTREAPAPKLDPDSSSAPRPPSVSVASQTVSIPSKSAKYAYAAYGEGWEKAEAVDKAYLVKDKEASKPR